MEERSAYRAVAMHEVVIYPEQAITQFSATVLYFGRAAAPDWVNPYL